MPITDDIRKQRSENDQALLCFPDRPQDLLANDGTVDGT
jgi:hypothetical protein